MTLRQASILMLIAAAMWGTNPALVKLADWNPIATAWLRGGFCGIVLLIYIMVSKKFSTQSFLLQFFCGFCLAINSALFVAASTFTSPANAVVLMFIFPWITIALDFFVKGDKPHKADIIRLVIGLGGITFIVSGGISSPNIIGDVFAIFAGIAIALHIFFSQKLSSRHGGNKEILSAIAMAWGITCIGLLPFILFSESLSLGLTAPSQQQWGYLVAFGLLSALPWLLWGKAIAHISGHVVAALLGVEVFTAAILGWWVLGITPLWTTWVGGLLVLGAAGHQIALGREN